MQALLTNVALKWYSDYDIIKTSIRFQQNKYDTSKYDLIVVDTVAIKDNYSKRPKYPILKTKYAAKKADKEPEPKVIEFSVDTQQMVVRAATEDELDSDRKFTCIDTQSENDYIADINDLF